MTERMDEAKNKAPPHRTTFQMMLFSAIYKRFILYRYCPAVGKSQIYFLTFAQLWASLKFIFWRLPKPRQVPNLFFDVCRNLGKAQIYFLMFAGTSASSFTSKREDACLSASPLLYCFEINGALRAFPYLLFQPWLVKHTNKLQHGGFVCDRLRLNCLQQDFRYPCLLHS